MAKLIDITGKCISGEWGLDDNDGTGIPVLRTTNFTNDGIVNFSYVVTRQINKKNLSDKYLKQGDIIIEKSGGSDNQPVGRVIYFDGQENTYLFNNFTGLLRVADQTTWLPKYIFYALFANYQNGGTRSFENKTTGLHNLKTDSYVQSVDIKEISYEDQKRIVTFLDKITYLISLRKQQLSKLDELVKSRFIEMFGDSVTNEKNWPRLMLGDICEVGSSKRVFEKDYVPSGIPFFRTKEIVELSKGNPITTELFITEEHFAELKKSYGAPQKNDLLISAVGTIGTIWIVSGDFEFYFKDGNLIQIKSSPTFNSIFMKYLLDELIANYKKEMSTGTAYSALTISGLKKMLVYDVPLEFQKKFAAFVKQTDKSKLEIQKSLEKLETLKKALMQKYFG